MPREPSANYEDVQQLVFAPSPLHPVFEFNARGVDLVLVSLACFAEREMPPPSPLPLQASLPPVAGQTNVGSTSLMAYIASRVSISLVIALGFVFCYMLCKNTMCCRRWCGVVLGRVVIGQAESANESPHADRGKVAPMAPAQADMFYDGATLDDDYEVWSVVLRLDDEHIEAPPLPMSCASSIDELKEAIGALTYELRGGRGTPSEWIDGDFDSMCIQYLTMQVEDLSLFVCAHRPNLQLTAHVTYPTVRERRPRWRRYDGVPRLRASATLVCYR